MYEKTPQNPTAAAPRLDELSIYQKESGNIEKRRLEKLRTNKITPLKFLFENDKSSGELKLNKQGKYILKSEYIRLIKEALEESKSKDFRKKIRLDNILIGLGLQMPSRSDNEFVTLVNNINDAYRYANNSAVAILESDLKSLISVIEYINKRKNTLNKEADSNNPTQHIFAFNDAADARYKIDVIEIFYKKSEKGLVIERMDLVQIKSSKIDQTEATKVKANHQEWVDTLVSTDYTEKNIKSSRESKEFENIADVCDQFASWDNNPETIERALKIETYSSAYKALALENKEEAIKDLVKQFNDDPSVLEFKEAFDTLKRDLNISLNPIIPIKTINSIIYDGRLHEPHKLNLEPMAKAAVKG